MKYINLAIEDETHEHYKACNVSWLCIVKTGIEIIKTCGSYEAYKKLIAKIRLEQSDGK